MQIVNWVIGNRSEGGGGMSIALIEWNERVREKKERHAFVSAGLWFQLMPELTRKF